MAITGALAMGCGELRGADDGTAAVTYKLTVGPLLAKRCVSCHSGAKAEGSYDLSTYAGLLGPGTDTTRNVIPGDATSRLLTKLDSAKEATHWGHLLPKTDELVSGETADTRRTADLKALTAWVVDHGLAYGADMVHPPGWVYPGKRSSGGFHGGLLRARGWKTTGCQECHGADLRGNSKAGGGSCYTCHTSGVTSCTVCHGDKKTGSSAPPMDLSWNLTSASRGVGAHAAHLGIKGPYPAVACADCHKVPTSTDAAGHLFDDAAGKKSDLTAEVVLSGTAAKGNITAAYDQKTGTCTVYCHGASLTSAGTDSKPVWNSTKKSTCGSCHAAPHTNPAYGGADCSVCHQQVFKACSGGSATCFDVNSKVKLEAASAALHLDGKVSLGKAGGGTCDGCHGTAASAGAPAPDLSGKSATSLVTVGLHDAHLKTSGSLVGPVKCADCHKVPKALKDAGHIDSDLPAEVTFSALATGKGKPTWDRTKGTCANVYCHTGSGGSVTTWSWTAKASPTLGCNSCHGNPPTKTSSGSSHPASLTCDGCHSSAYDKSGALNPAVHLNGKVDL